MPVLGAELVRTSEGSYTRAAELSPDAQELFGTGTIPRLNHLDQKYRNSKKQCRSTWGQLRRKPIQSRTLISTQTILAKARINRISETAVKRALAVFIANKESIPNQRYITVIDYNKRSNEKRLFTIDTTTAEIKSYYVAAGKGSDRAGRGIASHFSNRHGTNASSVGCFIAAGEYNGKGGRRSLILHGFESTNDNACDRATIMHPAGYVGGVPGRSWGCPALRPGDVKEVYGKVGGGGLICAHKDGPILEAAGERRSAKKKKSYSQNRRHSRGRRA